MTRLALVAAMALACASPHGHATGAAPGSDWHVAGKIDFELDNTPGCGGAAGPSPTSQCSRAHYSGGIQAIGDTAVQSFTPIDESGLVFITENEVIHFPDGDLRTRVNAVFHATSPDLEFVSMHTVVGGTGRYEGATGHLQLKGHGSKETNYVGVIRLAR